MLLITAFAITVIAGDLVAIGICSIVERFSEMGSMILFLILFVAVIPLAWRLAVRATEPNGSVMRMARSRFGR
jgi:hypothetical protein